MNIPFLRALVATLILILHLPDDRVVITADSRTSMVVDGKVVSHTDDACKIRPLNMKLVFVVIGLPIVVAADRSTAYDAYKNAYAAAKSDHHTVYTRAVVDAIAADWAGRMKDQIQIYQSDYHATFTPSQGTTGVFVGVLDDGSTYGAVEDIDSKDGQVVIIKKPPLPVFLPLGNKEATEMAWHKIRDTLEVPGKHVDPGLMMYQLEGDTILELKSELVGGPVDEFAFGPNMSPLWIHKKPACPEN